ncbi:Cof-type HAD-IIB family hydrolase [Streptococcus pantholopis]|uniref:HAD family hydrolase n=1 Tax=Streptococcus pantholopis TaxID=1811193 RepID=A0A172Q747_9STRE|nr:Cof-type HAD-IIB family hydrolase [Streptococcus pantholopis]AND79288.1 HAD family hydrolase [Streptococcus pantholopis]
MTVKIIATDMDGTFLTNKKTYDKALFNRLFLLCQEKEIKFVAASGNQYRQIIQQFPDWSSRIAVVAENGGHIVADGRTLAEEFVKSAAVTKLLDYVEENYPETVINLAGKKSSYMLQKTPAAIKEALSYYLPAMQYVDNLHTVSDDDFFKVTLLVEEALTFTIQKEINTLFIKDGLRAVSSGFGCLDIIPAHVHKGTGLKYLLEYWGLTADSLLAFGDGGNDLEMLKLAKYSYAMANATAEVKNTAAFQAPSNEENGVLKVMASYLMKQEAEHTAFNM